MAHLEHAPAALPDELRRFYASYGYQSDLTFGPLMLRNQREFGALPAAIEGDVQLSWNELVDAAGRFGGFLQANGIEPGRLESYDDPAPINVGVGEDVTIRELAEMVREVVGFKGDLVWDTTKPDGTPRKLLDVTRLRALGWRPEIELHEGIQSTYAWFLEHMATDARL